MNFELGLVVVGQGAASVEQRGEEERRRIKEIWSYFIYVRSFPTSLFAYPRMHVLASKVVSRI
jgi:hypothetical protein